MFNLAKHFSRLGTVTLLSLTSLACTRFGTPNVNNATLAELSLQTSTSHDFKDVVAYVDDDTQQLVIFGKVTHRHDDCPAEGHVDLAIIDSAGAVAVRQSLPLTRRGGKHGWLGAAFRTRIDSVPPQNSQIHLVFHDSDCAQRKAPDCSGNVAVKN